MTDQLFPTDQARDFGAPAQEDTHMASGYPGGRTPQGRARADYSSCRSCGAEMRWVTFPSGKRNPLDTRPDPHKGNIVLLEHPGGWTIAIVLTSDSLVEEARDLGTSLYTTHFKTCPNADAHRKPRHRADVDG